MGASWYALRYRIAQYLSVMSKTGKAPPDLIPAIESLRSQDDKGCGDKEFFMEVMSYLEVMSNIESTSGSEFSSISAEEFRVLVYEHARELAQADPEVQAFAEAQKQQEAEEARRLAEQLAAKQALEEVWRRREAARAEELRVIRLEELRIFMERQRESEAHQRAKAQAEFNDLGTEMSRIQSRDRAIAISRRRAELARMIGYNFSYENHCWRCKEDISSAINVRCPVCRWYICTCGACGC